MKYQLKDSSHFIFSNKPLYALRKFVRRIVDKMRINNINIFDMKNEEIVLIDSSGKSFSYNITIVPNNEEHSNPYYTFDYKIVIYKLLNIL